MPRESVATAAKHLLYQASQRLNVADPLSDVGPVIDESLAVPMDDPAAHESRLLEPSFSETTPENLAFRVGAGPALSASDRVETATKALEGIVARRFGRDASHWLASRVEAVKDNGHKRSSLWGASFAGGFDRNGVAEAAVHYEWGPMLMDSLPAPLYRLARVTMESLPGLRPAMSTIRCGRRSGAQQITFEIERALPLAALQPLMDRIGLGHQHAGLMSALAFALGARFTLPPETATLTVKPTGNGCELRIDVFLDYLPDVPTQLMALLRLQMTERPRSLHALDRWLMALTPDGYPGPGSVSVLSVWVRGDMPARTAIYLRPAALDAEVQPVAAQPRQTQPSSQSAWAAWTP